MRRAAGARAAASVLLTCGACIAEEAAPSQGAGQAARRVDLPYATELVAFEPGAAAGYGMDALPDVVLGPPMGGGTGKGGLDVVSLGLGGEIVLGFGERVIVDGDGADFVVFENAFWAGGDPNMPFVDPAEVAVSADGEDFRTFVCDARAQAEPAYAGCAGVHPTLAYDASDMPRLDPSATGGDAFDLRDVGLDAARFVRIRDLSDEGEGTTAGFDLDAVGIIHERQ